MNLRYDEAFVFVSQAGREPFSAGFPFPSPASPVPDVAVPLMLPPADAERWRYKTLCIPAPLRCSPTWHCRSTTNRSIAAREEYHFGEAQWTRLAQVAQ